MNSTTSFWCAVPTEEAGLLGVDFLKESGAIVDLQCNKMSLGDIAKGPERMARRSN